MTKRTINGTLYEEVVGVTYEYLGPTAGRFVARQVRNHLGKDPSQLCKRDLADLIVWVKLAMALLSEDTDLINRYVASLERLASGKARRTAGN